MLPQYDVAYALQKPVDQAITRLKNNPKLKGKPRKELENYIKTELNHIRNISQLQANLADYQKATHDEEAFASEPHDSDRLGKYMRASGLAKPAPRWEAHAIISGAHGEADVLRAILALNNIRVDAPDNGAWLPKAERDRIGTDFPNAVVHGRIHRWHYYRWLEREITFEMDEKGIRETLTQGNGIRHQLQHSSFDPVVMKSKGET